MAIYLPMIPEAIIAFLACTRIGAVHSVVFAGFSSDSLRDRVLDAESHVVITTDEGKRGGKLIGTKKIVDDALKQCPDVRHVLVYKRTGADVPMTKGRDLWWHEEVDKWPSYIAPEYVNSEDPLFLLYTSGSTGKPKGVMHTTAGYLVGAAATGKYVFDIHENDKYFCGGDVGWITGTHLCRLRSAAARCLDRRFRGHTGLSQLFTVLGYHREAPGHPVLRRPRPHCGCSSVPATTMSRTT